MTDKAGGVGKKRKLPDSAPSASVVSAANEAMGQSNRDGDTTESSSEIGDIKVDAPSIVEHISYVEFYSGVGGWTMALHEALDKLGPLLSSMRTQKSKDTAASPKNASTVDNIDPENTATSDCSQQTKTLRRYELKRLAALDHSDLCVKVFSHNFVPVETETTTTTDTAASDSTTNCDNEKRNRRKRRQKNSSRQQQKSFSIERMPLRQLEEWSADVWVMSPPCQPHTRQHNNNNHQQQDENTIQQKKDLNDPRSKSFLKICEWLEGTPSDGYGDDSSSNETNHKNRLSDNSLPSLIFLENVVGFESSHSFVKWQSALKSRGYMVGHFHLTPTQVGLPNDRPRFYSVAFRSDASGGKNSFPSVSATPSTPDTDSSSVPSAQCLLSYLREEGTKEDNALPRIWKAIPELHVTPEDCVNENEEGKESIAPISSFLDCNHIAKPNTSGSETHTERLRVPEKVLKNQSAWCFDIVTPRDRRSSCFTHSYGRFIRGTGSILYDDEKEQNGDASNQIQLLPPEQREFQADWMDHLNPAKLRYFSGNELARLFGFSRSFSFPPDTSLKQQWKLMGNSLNVRVASKLVELGFLLQYYYSVNGHNRQCEELEQTL